MRKHQQKQILEMLETLNEAQAAGLYEGCRDAAVSIGSFIKSIEGEGTQTVVLLEEYCELLFKASNGEIDKKGLRKHLIKVENSIKSELRPNRFEVAFLSYNASMSDAIKSIYFAAKTDPNCDAYWIPIPFYEKNNDGSLGAMHFEGVDYYSEYFNCVNWREYDIEARRPDVIFTFAPYDEGNFVTSVHPDFYCERLRRLTDCLVYIPYFVAIDDVPEHFCTVAGCAFAHKVVLQSEKVRNTYIRVFKERHGSKFGNPKDKFVALGSPKFDEARRKDYILPDKWKRLIYDKKIVFYNTSVGAILAGNEQYLKKLCSVLDTFRNHRDIVLWWRPHPLSEATYKSMRPQLLGEYQQIIADYKREGWGIYDETPDLYLAITFSDAYYGDWSSVVPLYQSTGKPIVIQDVDKLYAFTELGHQFPLMLSSVNNTIYYFMSHRNALLSLDVNTLSSRYLQPIPNNPIFGEERLYNYAEIVDDKLYFIPSSSDNLVIYDYKNKSFNITDLGLQERHILQGAWKFYRAIRYKHLLFLLPYTYSAIIAYNMKTGETIHCFNLCDVLSELHIQGTNKTGFFYNFEWLDSTRVLLPLRRTNAVLEFDLEDFSYFVHRIGKPDNSLDAIIKHGIYYWIVLNNKPVVIKWDYSTNEIDTLKTFPKGFDKYAPHVSTYYFATSAIAKYKCFLYLFPSRANMVCRLNMDTGIIERLEEFDEYCERDATDGDCPIFNGSCVNNNKIYIWSTDNLLLEYDFESRIIRECNKLFELSDEDNQRLAQDFIDSLVSGTETVTKLELPEIASFENVGQLIHDYMRKIALG